MKHAFIIVLPINTGIVCVKRKMWFTGQQYARSGTKIKGTMVSSLLGVHCPMSLYVLEGDNRGLMRVDTL